MKLKIAENLTHLTAEIKSDLLGHINMCRMCGDTPCLDGYASFIDHDFSENGNTWLRTHFAVTLEDGVLIVY